MFNLFKSRPTLLTPNDRLQFVLLVLIRISLIVAILWAGIVQDWENLGMSLLAYASTYVPTFLERHYRVYLPIEFHLVVVGLLYCSLFLGEVGQAYDRFVWWDVMLHLSSGVVLGFVGFLILYEPYVQKKLKMSPSLIAFFSFCVALACGALWEIVEFTIDHIFGSDMQHGNTDTMKDLIVDTLGAIGVAIAGYRYVKKEQRGPLARFINNFVALNPQLFRTKRRLQKERTSNK